MLLVEGHSLRPVRRQESEGCQSFHVLDLQRSKKLCLNCFFLIDYSLHYFVLSSDVHILHEHQSYPSIINESTTSSSSRTPE